jgi:hypothetical protein
VPPTPDEIAPLKAALEELVRDHDNCWTTLDFVGLSQLWERDCPRPVYLGDEYAAPLIGAEEIDRHWARVGGRLKRASVSSTIRASDELGDGLARCVLLSRWRLVGRESDVERAGGSWITWLLVRRGGRLRIFHHMESQVHLPDG